MEALLDDALRLLPRIGAGLLILGVFWGFGWAVCRITARIGRGGDQAARDVVELVGQAMKYGLIVIGAISALGTIGINVSALIAGLGLTGFALGFALRDALSNLLAGVLVLIYKPFRRGAYINVAGFDGIVTGIDLRYTTLQRGPQRILIPNSVLFTHSIVLGEDEQPPATPAPASPGAAPLAASRRDL
ncbi:mechanosensitive ion channel [Ectothiorhodospiraceae bacterium 2226]|nr:mechanosensitive ion channel [Ectothiorhodospiraceae bacterium 2226]